MYTVHYTFTLQSILLCANNNKIITVQYRIRRVAKMR